MPIPLNMLPISNTTATLTADDDEVSAEADEPPDHRQPGKRPSLVQISHTKHSFPPYNKPKSSNTEPKKESLLTRALISSPELSPVDPLVGNLPSINNLKGLSTTSAPLNVSVPSTAELTSDSGATTPLHSNTPSPPPIYNSLPTARPKGPETSELEIEANLGRKRCITFACGRKNDLNEQIKASSDTAKEVKHADPPKRKSMLTFVCPSRPSASDNDTRRTQSVGHKIAQGTRASRSPAPQAHRKTSLSSSTQTLKANSPVHVRDKAHAKSILQNDEFKLSDAIRFHEFASAEDDDWVNETPDYKKKMTLSDCMRKENVIRQLGEEVEEEVQQEEEDLENDEDDDEDEDENEDDDDDDEEEDDDEENDDDSDGDNVSDDGNESDNEAGFASDDSDNDSEPGFWTPNIASTATSFTYHTGRQTLGRKDSVTSVECTANERDTTPLAKKTTVASRVRKAEKFRPGTPNLPDSTDFVCGTLDEDRPIEAAYISCMEERRRSKHIPIPQDIDPSFPTSEPEDDDDDDDGNEDDGLKRTAVIITAAKKKLADEEAPRGRTGGHHRRMSPAPSPKRLHSPPPRCLFGRSPRRLRSPAPAGRLKSPPPTRRTSLAVAAATKPTAIKFAGLAQRPNRIRTSSLPQTPNPFFLRLAQRHRSSRSPSPSRKVSRKRTAHTRGPIDIVAGLQKKREKRKEKFWRQHCRKAAKEQLERRPLFGKGAERMKELGLGAAERLRAYGIPQDAQLVLSV